ncbi:hypothetical protein ACFX1Z_004395 [Malus domestica]
MKYQRRLKKNGRNKTTRPKGNSDPSGVTGQAGRCTPTELKAFKDLGVASEHLEESYLATFLACWLCKFVFPKDEVNFVRPRVFKVASKMAASESFSLAISVLANIYNGLGVVLNSASTEDRVVVLPYHYVYGWLGEYFGSHFSSSTLDKSRLFSPTSVKLAPLMTKYSGVFFANGLNDLQAQALFRSYEGLKMYHLARVGLVRRCIMDHSYLRFSDLSYLISLRSGYVSLRQEDRCIVQPYSPHRFSRQFGFVQNVLGKLREKARLESLQVVYMHWESYTRACTNASITLPAKDEFKNNPVIRVYVNWWSKLVLLDCASAAPLQDGPVDLVHQRPCLSPQHPDAYKEVGDEVDSCKDGFVLQQRQQIINKRPLEGAQADIDVNFRHKKKKAFGPSQFGGHVSPDKDVHIHFFLVTYFHF